MDLLDIVFLGTGSAIPTVSRNHTSIYLKYRDRGFLIDCGEGTQRQMKKAGLNVCKISDILITHFHGDHILGLPGLMHTLDKSGYNKKLRIYCPKNSKEVIIKFLEITGIHKSQYEIKEVNGNFIDTDYFFVEALALEHDVPCNGYAFVEKDKLRFDKKKLNKYKISGKDIGLLAKGKSVKINSETIKSKDITYLEKGRKISFIFDTQSCNNISRLVRNSDLAIMEGVFLSETQENKEIKYKHLTVEDTARIAKKNKVKELIITHISPRYDFKEDKLLKIAKKIFLKTKIARDLMKVEL